MNTQNGHDKKKRKQWNTLNLSKNELNNDLQFKEVRSF